MKFEDHVSQSRDIETEIGLVNGGDLDGGMDAAEAENSDGTMDNSATALNGEAAAKLDDDESGAAELENSLVEIRTGEVDQGGRTSPSNGNDAKVRTAKDDLSGVGLTTGTGSSAPKSLHSTGDVAISKGLRTIGTAPAEFSPADIRAKLPRANETTKTEPGGMRREFFELPQIASSASLLSGHKSAVSNPESGEPPPAKSRDALQHLGSLVLPSNPGQPHLSMADELQNLHNPNRPAVSKLTYKTPTQVMERDGSPVIRQQTTGSASILLAQGTDQAIHSNLNALISIQGKQEHQPLANNIPMGERLVLDAPQSMVLPPFENTANLSGSPMTAAQPLNVFSGASLVGVGGLNPVQPALAQILDAIGKSASGAIIVALNPRELGRVRMSMMASENGFVVSIMAERAETLDIMRRHSEALMDEFRRFGFENPDLEFSHGGSNFNPSSDGVAVTANTETELEQLPRAPEAARSRAHETTGLDMRI